MFCSTLEHARLIKKRLESSWARDRHRVPYLVIDTETEPRPGFTRKDALVIGRAQIKVFAFCFRGQSYSFGTSCLSSRFPLIEEYVSIFSDWFFDQRIIKVFHNANYDIMVAYYDAGVKIIRNIWDTMIGAWRASEYKEKGLKERAPQYGRYLNATKNIDFNDPVALAHYAEQDVIQTDELFQMQFFGKVLRGQSWVVDSKGRMVLGERAEVEEFVIDDERLDEFGKLWLRLQELPVLRATMRAEIRGFPVHLPRLYAIRQKARLEMREALKVVYRHAGRVVNVRSFKDKQALFEELGIENPHKSYDERAMLKLRGQHPVIDAMIKYGKLQKLISVYIGDQPLNQDDYPGSYKKCGLEYYVNPRTGCIHATASTCGAVTGRGCVTGDTLVETPYGSLPIRAIVSEYETKIKKTAVSFNGRRRVCNAFRNGYQKVFELVTESGKRIRATSEHKFLTPSGWVKLADLKEGDCIAEVVGARMLMKTRFTKVVAIRKVGVRQTFDLEVERVNAYVANGLVVHNSSSNPNMQQIPSRKDRFGFKTIFVANPRKAPVCATD